MFVSYEFQFVKLKICVTVIATRTAPKQSRSGGARLLRFARNDRLPAIVTSPLLTLLNARDLAAYTAAGYWGSETLYATARRHAEATPDAFAVRDRTRRLSYRALIAAADRLAAHLAGAGLRAGERVALWAASRVETAVTLLAASRQGYVCCPSLHRGHD